MNLQNSNLNNAEYNADSTRMIDNSGLNTEIMEGPASADAMADITADTDAEDDITAQRKGTTAPSVGRRVAFGAGGFVVGGAMAAGISAMASDSDSPKESTLAAAATPDDEVVPGSEADTVVSDPSVAPEQIDDTFTVIEEPSAPAAYSGHHTPAASRDVNAHPEAQLIGGNPVGDSRTDAPVAELQEGHGNEVDINVNVNPSAGVVTVTPQTTVGDHMTDGQIEIAVVDQTNDFNTAFWEARAQVGAGGCFEYNGNIYSTFTTQEWEELSPSQQAQFMNDVRTQSTSSDSFADNSQNIEVNSVGTLTDADGNTMAHAEVNIDGHNVVMVDNDNDGVIDFAVVDANADGEISSDEIIDMTQVGVTIDDMQAYMHSHADGSHVCAPTLDDNVSVTVSADELPDNIAANDELAMNTDFDPDCATDF